MYPSLEIEKKVFEKIISMKTLEKITIEFKEINNEEIKSIGDENKFLKYANVNHWNNGSNICDMRPFQNKFPNLKTLDITGSYILKNENLEINIDIIENENCKVKEIGLNFYFENDLKIYTSHFKDLVKCNLSVYNKINNIKNNFPLFKENCQINFISLKSFSFINESDIDIEVIKNIYDNFKYMPNLKYFHFDCISSGIEEDFYMEFYKNILSLDLGEIFIKIRKDSLINPSQYSLDELKELYPNIKQLECKEIEIYKFFNENEENEEDEILI